VRGVRAWSLAARGRGAEPVSSGWSEPVAGEVVVEAVIERSFPAPGAGVRAWPAWLLAGLDRLRSRFGIGSRGLAAAGRRIPEPVEVPVEERVRDGREPGPGAGGG
jgi:hypothetical protein